MKIRSKTLLIIVVLYLVPWIALIAVFLRADLSQWVTRIMWLIAGTGGGLFLLEATILMSSLSGRLQRLSRRVEAVLSDSPTSRAQRPGELLVADHRDEIGKLYELFNYVIKHSDQTIYTLATDPGTWINQAPVPQRERVQSASPDLGGDSTIVTTFHSSMEGFESILENSEPAEVVEILNRYFPLVIDTVKDHGGEIIQLIRDDVMAYFSSPDQGTNVPLIAVISALEIQQKLNQYNEGMGPLGQRPLHTGIGIDYGVGSLAFVGTKETVQRILIGAVVDRGSRLLRFTSQYKQPVLFTESVFRKIEKELPCRLVDRVIVKGATQAVDVYTAARSLNAKETEAWDAYREGIEQYRRRNFDVGKARFTEARKNLPDDFLVRLYQNRCEKFMRHAPPEDWDGIDYLRQ